MIFMAKFIFDEAEYNETDVQQLDRFSIMELYCNVRGDYHIVDRKRLVWNNYG